MKRTGLQFYIEGEYCKDLNDDPNKQEWIPFDTTDLHPRRKRYITIWSQFEEPDEKEIEELTQRAIHIVEYFKDEVDWTGFVASLWLRETGKDRRVIHWDLA